MNNHISSWLTHIDDEKDVPYLRSKLLDVNMRLFHLNDSYRSIVIACCNHISAICLVGLHGYKLPHGMSGANVAIPFNIIAIAMNRGTEDATAKIMINPRLVGKGGGPLVETTTNCGSIRLAEPIKVMRNFVIEVEYYDMKGAKQVEFAYPHSGSFTIQHEIDHNLGILITDRKVT